MGWIHVHIEIGSSRRILTHFLELFCTILQLVMFMIIATLVLRKFSHTIFSRGKSCWSLWSDIFFRYFLDTSNLRDFLIPLLARMNYVNFGDLYLPTSITLVNQSSGTHKRLLLLKFETIQVRISECGALILNLLHFHLLISLWPQLHYQWPFHQGEPMNHFVFII